MEFIAEIYNELIENISLESVQLFGLECKQFENSEPGLASVDVQLEMHTISREAENVIIPAEFKISAIVSETQAKVFEINFIYTLLYELPVDKTYDEEYLERFAKVNAPINIWPYARELVSNLTTRMGFPSLYIPLYK
ncbi:protein-export chaperone SecB [Neobacillus drentensis]|uniref:protein-export chaperone SecB n=1 Tax=Neobacillus drentensis TaxID=220684 RepID=UPI003000911C